MQGGDHVKGKGVSSRLKLALKLLRNVRPIGMEMSRKFACPAQD